MPRLARNVFPGVPHHITQRGNCREDVFFRKSGVEKNIRISAFAIVLSNFNIAKEWCIGSFIPVLCKRPTATYNSA
jgi:REP element-mobilizing transposase RayT